MRLEPVARQASLFSLGFYVADECKVDQGDELSLHGMESPKIRIDLQDLDVASIPMTHYLSNWCFCW
jgi:hypothetical protein